MTERLLFLLFAFLFVLLLLSNLIISYSNLFRNREAAYLMSLPIPAQTIFQLKFFESTLLASWAFLFLIAPLLAAFGLTRDVAWHFYPVTLLLIGLFVVLPGVGGSWLALNLARYLDRRAFQVAALLVALGTLGFATFWWHSQPRSEDMTETRVLAVLDQLLEKTRFAQFPFLPSYWLSMGVLQWAEGALKLAGFFGLVLLSNVMFFGLLAFTQLGDLYATMPPRASRAGPAFGGNGIGSAPPPPARRFFPIRWGSPKKWSTVSAGGSRPTRAPFAGEGCPDVLARHDPVGPDGPALWVAGCLCHQCPPLHRSACEFILDPSQFPI